MAGHSKWHNIKGTKAVQDAKRGALFAKISRDIIIATQLGGSPDPNFNTFLRMAINKAKTANMTSDKIEKAINKGMGKSNGDDAIEQKTYEAYGFNGVVLLIDTETDNPNRAITELKTIVTRNGAKMVPEGSISWQFSENGTIVFTIKNEFISEKDSILLEIMSLDRVEDIMDLDDGTYKIIVQRERLKNIADKLKENFSSKIEIEEVNIEKLAKDKVNLEGEALEKNMELIELIKDYPEVVNVWSNID